jgi:hypothetical protein
VNAEDSCNWTAKDTDSIESHDVAANPKCSCTIHSVKNGYYNYYTHTPIQNLWNVYIYIYKDQLNMIHQWI